MKLLLKILAALVVAAIAMLALPVAVRQLVDYGLAAESAATLNRYFTAFLAAAGLFGAFAAVRFYLVSWVGERIVADVRDAVYRRVIRMDPAFFEVTRTGEVLSRLTTDTTLVQTIAGSSLSIALRSALNLTGSLVMLALTSAKLMGVIVVCIPLVIAPLILVGRQVRGLSRASQDRIAESSGLAGETLNAIQTVQAFTLEALHSARYRDAVEDSFDVAVQRTRVRAWLTALATMLVFGAITAVLWVGAHQVLSGQMTSGELVQFLVLAVYAGIAAASLSEMWSEVQRAAGAMERLVELRRQWQVALDALGRRDQFAERRALASARRIILCRDLEIERTDPVGPRFEQKDEFIELKHVDFGAACTEQVIEDHAPAPCVGRGVAKCARHR